jgi:molybdenum cofactor cytidylyltransferase
MTQPYTNSLDLIGAVVLAAGMSTRMGQPKQLLPWGTLPMVRHVVNALLAGGVSAEALVVVTGHEREAVEAAVLGSRAQVAFNAEFADGSMLRSQQVGLRALDSLSLPVAAAFTALGDQPQIDAGITRRVIEAWRQGGAMIAAPSFGRRRGHPILFARAAWADVLAAPPVGSPREILEKFSGKTTYVEVVDDAVLRDIDTPEDYRRELARRV